MPGCQVIEDLEQDYFKLEDKLFFFSGRSSLDRVCAADPECVPDDGDYRAYSGASSVVFSILLLPLLVVHQL